MKNVTFVIAMILLASVAFAQDMISADDLAKKLRDTNLVVVSAGPKTEYDKQHITGSVNVPYNAFDKAGAPEGLLIADADIARILGENGISEKNAIVVYDEYDGRYAARVYFLLKYMGATDVKVLEGGIEGWKAGRKPITRNPTQITKKTFTPKVNSPVMVSARDLVNARPNSVMVDARSQGDFQGRDNGSKGHIPGSINIEYKEVLAADGKLKSKADLEKLYVAKGVTRDKEVVLYCSSGVRTGWHYLVLTALLNYPNVKVYDGGYNEWITLNPSKIAK